MISATGIKSELNLKDNQESVLASHSGKFWQIHIFDIMRENDKENDKYNPGDLWALRHWIVTTENLSVTLQLRATGQHLQCFSCSRTGSPGDLFLMESNSWEV